MKRLVCKVRGFFAGGDGRTAVHCAVLLELITIVCLVAIGSISTTATAAPHSEVVNSATSSK
jgi:Flp pilus assembly pilin Flp